MVPPPFPKHSFVIPGGCNCNAIRYKITVPEFGTRSPCPYRNPGADIGDLRIPMSVVCHCPDCRKATGAVPAKAIITETRTVEVSLASRESAAEIQGPLNMDGNQQFVPADGVFDFRNTDLGKSFLAVYKSSPKRSRWFCSRCGTPVGYSVDPGVIPPEWGWPLMLDIWLGTIDTSTLQEPWMAPERMLWCEKGIDWVKQDASNGAGGIPLHPVNKIDVVIARDAAEGPSRLDGVQ